MSAAKTAMSGAHSMRRMDERRTSRTDFDNT
jgi:hypothetical protein